MYQPIKKSLQMNTPAMYYACSTRKVNGRDKKVYDKAGILLRGQFKEKSGTETEINDVKLINKSITFICWYDPRIKQDGKLDIYGNLYEIRNVENVEMRNRYMTCTLEYIGAGA